MASATFYGENHGLQIENNYGSVTAQFGPYNHADIDRGWIEKLRCPNSLAVKNSLKQAKDKLLRRSFEWVLHDPQYRSWRYGNDICLLWIKGGAGKGKTMMSIGLIEVLSREHDIGRSAVVIYFFCQNADNELNTVASIIKGLIFGLISQRDELKESLRRRWDWKNERFSEDLDSWRALWRVFLEMLEHCECPRVYIIVDALDECRLDGDHDMADFLKFIVRNGADHPSKIKWILTSRPLDTAERYLVARHEQVQVSLELNSECVSDAVNHYISYRVEELCLLQGYGERLKREIQMILTEKAEGTYLWVSLVCKRLEVVCRDEALPTIQNLPPGLPSFYNQIFDHLNRGEPDVVQKCLRLLKVMTLVYRPLRLEEVSSVTGLTNEEDTIKALIDRCASFINLQGKNIHFVHQSAREFLIDEKTALDLHETFGHDEIFQSCLLHLSKYLKVNMMELPRPDLTRSYMGQSQNKKGNTLLASLDYAAIFWVQHPKDTREPLTEQHIFADTGTVVTFLRTKFLEWLECISLLGRPIKALQAFLEMETMTRNCSPGSLILKILMDGLHFVMLHYNFVAEWPLQIYTSAMIFSSDSSMVKRENINKIPSWLLKIPFVEENWISWFRTIKVHSKRPRSLAFSPDGTKIVSGFDDTSIKVWDTATGNLLKTFAVHSGPVKTVAFSPDGNQIISSSDDTTVRVWDTTTGNLLKTLAVHSGSVKTVVFSPDGKRIVLGSGSPWYKYLRRWDYTVFELQMLLLGHSGPIRTATWPDGKLFALSSLQKNIQFWNTATTEIGKKSTGRSGSVNTIAFSPDGKHMASSSFDKMIRLWDTTTGELEKAFVGHSRPVNCMAFSPDGKQIASGSADKKVKLWDARTGELKQTFTGHSRQVGSVVFSSDGKQIASGSHDSTIILWDAITGDFRRKVATRVNSEIHACYLDKIWAMSFSPDGKQIACCSGEPTLKISGLNTVRFKAVPAGHSSWVMSAAKFSPIGNQIASRSPGRSFTVRFWDSTTGDVQKTLTGADSLFEAPAYVFRSFIRRIFWTFEPSHSLRPRPDFSVKYHWLYYKGSRILHLPPEVDPLAHDVLGNQVCFGLRNGRVLSFSIDRSRLDSLLTRRSE